MTTAEEIITSLLLKFPKAPTLTIARIAHRDNPQVWRNLEAARKAVRYRRGASGEEGRKNRSTKSELFREPQQSGDVFDKIPEGFTSGAKWNPLQVDGPVNALVLSDIHFPYHERDPLLTALAHGKANGSDLVLLNGDTADFFSVSFWEKDPRQRDFGKELKLTKEFLKTLRDGFKKARIIFKLGNHEERWIRYMRVKCSELLGIDEFEIESILGLKDLGIELVADRRPVRLGHLNVLHGHEYRFAISNPVNAARGLFLRAKAYALCGHFHQWSAHTDRTVEQSVIATWSTGCLCEMHPEYAPLNNWSHGFALVEVFNNGKFNVRNHTIKSGKVY